MPCLWDGVELKRRTSRIPFKWCAHTHDCGIRVPLFLYDTTLWCIATNQLKDFRIHLCSNLKIEFFFRLAHSPSLYLASFLINITLCDKNGSDWSRVSEWMNMWPLCTCFVHIIIVILLGQWQDIGTRASERADKYLRLRRIAKALLFMSAKIRIRKQSVDGTQYYANLSVHKSYSHNDSLSMQTRTHIVRHRLGDFLTSIWNMFL